ncbi:MAG TPA: isoprenylcysteine carboxylmethyltransferase family protein [bacterium]
MKTIDQLGEWVFKNRDILPVPFIIIAVAGLTSYKPNFVYTNNAIKYSIYFLGFFFVIKGELIRIWAVGHAGFITHSRSKKLRAEDLVTTGPYEIVRNPIYLGNFLLGLGFVFLTLTWWLVILYILFFSFEYGLIIRAEERFLREKFSIRFEDYAKSVPRIIPSLSRFSFKNLGGFHLNYLYPERWTILNCILAGIVLLLLNMFRK